MSKTALIVIDVQNEYFPHGNYPQHGVDEALQSVKQAINYAQANDWSVVLVQHFMPEGAPLFQAGTDNVAIHADVLAAAADAPVVQKYHADSFLETNLDTVLKEQGVENIVICGIMTQNCVAYTAISPDAAQYDVKVLPAACCAPDPVVHGAALEAIRDRGVVFTEL